MTFVPRDIVLNEKNICVTRMQAVIFKKGLSKDYMLKNQRLYLNIPYVVRKHLVNFLMIMIPKIYLLMIE